MKPGDLVRCLCGAWVLWGSSATELDFALWQAWHEDCPPIVIKARFVDGVFRDLAGAPIAFAAVVVRGRGALLSYVVAPGEHIAARLALLEVEQLMRAAGARWAGGDLTWEPPPPREPPDGAIVTPRPP